MYAWSLPYATPDLTYTASTSDAESESLTDSERKMWEELRGRRQIPAYVAFNLVPFVP